MLVVQAIIFLLTISDLGCPFGAVGDSTQPVTAEVIVACRAAEKELARRAQEKAAKAAAAKANAERIKKARAEVDVDVDVDAIKKTIEEQAKATYLKELGIALEKARQEQAQAFGEQIRLLQLRTKILQQLADIQPTLPHRRVNIDKAYHDAALGVGPAFCVETPGEGNPCSSGTGSHNPGVNATAGLILRFHRYFATTIDFNIGSLFSNWQLVDDGSVAGYDKQLMLLAGGTPRLIIPGRFSEFSLDLGINYGYQNMWSRARRREKPSGVRGRDPSRIEAHDLVLSPGVSITSLVERNGPSGHFGFRASFSWNLAVTHRKDFLPTSWFGASVSVLFRNF